MTLPDLDRWQYRLSRNQNLQGLAIGAFWLEAGPDLPVIRIVDGAGKTTGALLGFPIDLSQSNLPQDKWSQPDGADGPDQMADAILRCLGGRFLLILLENGLARVYPDASAQVSCVYDLESGTVASTASALLDDAAYEARFQRALYERIGIDGEGWFPAGLTAHRGIIRLLPGHYLDLARGQMQRFWPMEAIQTAPRTEACVDEIIALVQTQIKALLSGSKRVALALTGGHETRMLLACARPFLDQVDIVTIVGSDRHATDTILARRIVRDMGLRHIELPRRTASAEERARFIRRGGHCNADSNSYFHPSVWPIADSHVFVGGLGGEIGRAFLWRASDTPATPLSTEGLINRLGLPQLPELETALAAWRGALPPLDAYAILDYTYHENRNGPWYAAQFCCDPTLVRHAPLLTRRAVELMFSLPEDWKRGSLLGKAVIARSWPELNRYPYNSLGPWQDAMAKVQRVLADPRIVLKKLRKMRG